MSYMTLVDRIMERPKELKRLLYQSVSTAAVLMCASYKLNSRIFGVLMW